MPADRALRASWQPSLIGGWAAVLAFAWGLVGCGGPGSGPQHDEAALYAEAVQAALDGNGSRAVDLLKTLIVANPRPAYFLAAGVERLKAGDAEGAAGHARAGLDVEPDDEDLRWLEGMAKKLAAGGPVPADPHPPSSRK